MRAVLPMFVWTVVSLLFPFSGAYPNGAGSCDGNGPAFSNADSVSHRSEAAGKTVLQEPSDVFQFVIDGEPLIAGQKRELDINSQWYWQLKAKYVTEGFKGFLVRYETKPGFVDFHVDCESEDPEAMKEADVGACTNSYITGCTHTMNAIKQQVTGTVEFYKALGDVKIDVTVVYENGESLSRYAYQQFDLSFVGPPTVAPSQQPSTELQEEPSSPTPSPVMCFSGQNTVHEQIKGTIPISDLRVGDLVRTMGGEYSRVYSLGHWDPIFDAEFLQFTLSDGTKLELSEDHMVMINGAFSSAKKARVGDSLTGDFGENKLVKLILHTRNYGVYAPLTEAGHLLVSGILSSSYVDFLELGYGHEIAHWILAPVRLYCHITFCLEETHTQGISNLIRPIIDMSLRIRTMYVPVQYAVLSIGALLAAPANTVTW